ncbi:uncharacterized protein Z518_02536 [Rhinocladiella mackenziei CBS 650.93]|uniref:Uncharacterized protein n=1 Tax=Rhinocladiella mackenziei CBS 650.93 TaxID=1442369 RepID=A0A0D2FZZ5_9EURO|nr:uncharacterized protein Z518_02536 [Rhinocladiella mackenziei CBS 650.93]KIX07882.1 hypothetical protein Z518_02536 [Rhinocladiella mackenziei CBS 650.93]
MRGSCRYRHYRDGPRNCRGTPALVLAAWKGHLEEVKLLLEYGADVHDAPKNGLQLNSLQAASGNGNVQIMSILIEAGADINSPAVGRRGKTALQYAVIKNKTAATLFLLELGADVNARVAEKGGMTALQAAVLCQNEDMVETLLVLGADINGQASDGGYSALSTAILSNSIPLFWRLIEASASVAYADWEDGDAFNMPLLVASRKGSLEFIQLLLDLGIDINALSRSGRTLGELALLEAAVHHQEKAMLFLLKHSDFIDRSILTKALEYVDLIIPDTQCGVLVQALVDRGADINAGWVGEDHSILQKACRKGVMELVRYLVQNGADINFPPPARDGLTALQAAVFIGDLEMVDFLLQHGADVNGAASHYGGVTAVQVAAVLGYVRIAQMLIAAGADIAAPASCRGTRALDSAARNGRFDMVKLLLDNYQLKGGESFSDVCKGPIRIARKECHWAIVALLENYQRDPDLGGR